jgi:uncharacterized protein
MRVGIIANTPAQVYFYNNIISKMEQDGNELYLLVRDYGETLQVLKELKISHYIYSSPPSSKYGKVLNLPFDILRAYKYLSRFKIDLITGFGVFDAYTSFLLKIPSIIFNDCEPWVNTRSYDIQFKMYMPFIETMITPDCFRQDLGRKQIKISSYKEMAYLHPTYYKPNIDILHHLGLEDGADYILLRFNAFDAVHDLSIKGFSDDDKIRLVRDLEKYCHVFISSEAGVPKPIRSHITKIPKSRIHDAIKYAKLLVTDTQTMATEGAILGTPTIRCNKFVGAFDMGNFIELENRYKLLFNCSDPKVAIEKSVEWARDNHLKQQFQKRREKLLREKIDVTKFMTWFLENYPSSLEQFRDDPKIQFKVALPN